jgi:SAM-dependent methyltransferase
MHAGFIAVAECWLCGNEQLTREHDAILDLDLYRDQHPQMAAYSGETVWFRRCSACGFAQPERLPALPGFFDLLYDQLWSADWVQQEFESSYKDFIFHTILRGLDARSARRGRLLDIGAHAGRFMHLARAGGWTPEGIEVNPRTAAFAARRTGLTVHAVNVDRLPLAALGYAAITLIDVLEHVPEPMTLLSRVEGALEAGGWTAIKVPSGPGQRRKERVRARLHRGYRPRLADNLVHVSHFSPEALGGALERIGFRHVTVEIAPPELPPARTYRAIGANVLRRSLYYGGRLLPRSVDTPLALNLLAFGQKPV